MSNYSIGKIVASYHPLVYIQHGNNQFQYNQQLIQPHSEHNQIQLCSGDRVKVYTNQAQVYRVEWIPPVLLQSVLQLSSDPLLTEGLQQKFASFRKLPLGPNSFYLALTVAVVERMLSPGNDFKQLVTEVLTEAAKVFNPQGTMLECISQTWAELDACPKTLEGASYAIGQCLSDDSVRDGFVYIGKLLLALAINRKRKGEKLTQEQKKQFGETINQVLCMNTSVDRTYFSFLASMLDCTLNIVTSEYTLFGFNEAAQYSLYLYEDAGNYCSLMTQTHSLSWRHSPDLAQFQKLTRLLNSLVNVENESFKALESQVKTLEVDVENEQQQLESALTACQLLGNISLQYFPRSRDPHIREACNNLNIAADLLQNIGKSMSDFSERAQVLMAPYRCAYCCEYDNTVKLDCGHFLCEEDVQSVIRQATQQLMVLNDFEIQTGIYTEAYCPVCKGRFDNRSVLRNLLSAENYDDLWNAALARQRTQVGELCIGCGQNCHPDQFFEAPLMECQHRCSCCTTRLVRNGSRECPDCQSDYSAVISHLQNQTMRCAGCYRTLSVLRNFTSQTFCQHEELCIDCISSLYRRRSCIVCVRPISVEEQSQMRALFFVPCSDCGHNYDRRHPLIMGRLCFCSVCIDCQSNNTEQCVKCLQALPEGVQQGLATFIENALQRRLEVQKDCKICFDTHSVQDTRALQCGHYFGEECLKLMLANYVQSKDTLEKVRSCPHEGCDGNISGLMLQELLTDHDFDRYNRFAIANSFDQIECPRCGFSFEPWNYRRVMCLNQDCKYIFCKICSEEYHDVGDCRETFIERKIRGLEEYEKSLPEEERSGVSQCPGCREPYVKDKNCEHVECLNPGCAVHFCFQCSCIRSPTLAHGNHFHRPGCRFLTAEPDQVKDPDKFRADCSECVRLGQLCARPKALRVPRRIAQDEVG